MERIKTSLRRFLPPVIAGAIILGLASIGTGQAFALSGMGVLCSNSGSGFCLSSNGKVGGKVYAKTYAKHSKQEHISIATNKSVCGGHVKKGCPFGTNSKFNSIFHGDQIVTLDNVDEGSVYYGADKGGYVVNRSSGAVNPVGYEWVFVNSAHLHVHDGLVNVYLTTNTGNASYMCALGKDQAVIIASEKNAYTKGICSWFFHG